MFRSQDSTENRLYVLTVCTLNEYTGNAVQRFEIVHNRRLVRIRSYANSHHTRNGRAALLNVGGAVHFGIDVLLNGNGPKIHNVSSIRIDALRNELIEIIQRVDLLQ